jgi:hypothetical protein
VVAEDALFEAFIELLAALSDETPLLLMIDDIHIADPAIWRFLRAVIRWTSARRIVWLFGYRALRDGELAHLPEGGIVQRIALRCLDRAAATALVVAANGGTTDIGRQRLYDLVGGHPLLLLESARSGGSLPSGVEWLIEDWTSRLPLHALQIVRIIATLGDCATPRALASLGGFARAELAAALGELERAGIIREDDGVLRAHAIWAEASLASLASAERLAINLD